MGAEVSPPEPPLPRFSDVLDAQTWASNLVRQVEEDAARMGRHGSPAWLDTWREALWTLAVQKRCVEVETRRLITTGAHTARGAPVSQLPQASHSPGNAAQHAIQLGLELLEARCLQPVQGRLDLVEKGLGRLECCLDTLRAVRDSRGQGVACAGSIGTNTVVGTTLVRRHSADVHGHVQQGPTSAAGPLPIGRQKPSVPLSDCDCRKPPVSCDHGELWPARHTSSPVSSTLEHRRDTENRDTETEQLQYAEQRLRHAEIEHEQTQVSLRKAERRADEAERKHGESERCWKQRFVSLQRQLRRTELGVHASPGPCSETRTVGEDTSEVDCTVGAGPSRADALELLREVRGLEHRIRRSPLSGPRDRAWTACQPESVRTFAVRRASDG
uniref:Uncharacterized protein n=1 Tax=Noctiluca scintillans TaxID=2966 RepID=A0A7S1A8V1_NOCSC